MYKLRNLYWYAYNGVYSLCIYRTAMISVVYLHNTVPCSYTLMLKMMCM